MAAPGRCEDLERRPWGGHKGRTGMADYVERDLGQYVATHHVSANHDIEIDGDTARPPLDKPARTANSA